MQGGAIVVIAALAGCPRESGPAGDSEPEDQAPAKASGPVAAPEVGDPSAKNADTPPSAARVLAAYHGLDRLPPVVVQLCPVVGAIGKDGLPVTFSTRLDADSVTPEVFAVETATGESVTPICATLRPADEPLENRTVLLAGDFGTPEAPPGAVRVVGELRDLEGNTVRGASTTTIVPLRAGPSLVLAERFAPTTAGLAGECPPATKQVVQLTWEGGVTGPDGADLGEAQRTAVTVTLEDGRKVMPIALADDDPDNIVHACLDDTTPATSVAVVADRFHDPADDPNPVTQVDVIPGNP